MTKEEFNQYYEENISDVYRLHNILKKLNNDIMNDNSWKLYKDLYAERGIIPDGIYLTIRAGLGGHIYTMENEMKDGKWLYQVTDGSYTIFYKELTFEMLKEE